MNEGFPIYNLLEYVVLSLNPIMLLGFLFIISSSQLKDAVRRWQKPYFLALFSSLVNNNYLHAYIQHSKSDSEVPPEWQIIRALTAAACRSLTKQPITIYRLNCHALWRKGLTALKS